MARIALDPPPCIGMLPVAKSYGCGKGFACAGSRICHQHDTLVSPHRYREECSARKGPQPHTFKKCYNERKTESPGL